MSRISFVVTVGILITVAVIIYFVFTPASLSVPTQAVYQSKVVYTTDLGVDQEPLVEDCRERQGTFNECGSPCEPDAEICASVCAYTCDDLPKRSR